MLKVSFIHPCLVELRLTVVTSFLTWIVDEVKQPNLLIGIV